MISVVIPVKNGGADLTRCLAGIPAQQIDEEVEIVVVDSGSTDGSPERARARRRASSTRSRRRSSVTAARATWASSSPTARRSSSRRRTRSRPTTRWLARLVAAAALGPGRRGRVRPPAPSPRRPSARALLPRLPLRAGAAGRSASSRAPSSRSRRRSSRTSTPRSRARSSSAIPFRDDLTMSEDQEWSRRVLRDGHSLVYEPRAAVRHSHAYTVRSAFRRFFDSGVSAEHAYVEGDESRAALRRAGARYAREELAGSGAPGSGAGFPYTVVYELGEVRRSAARAPPPPAPALGRRRLSSYPV